jgi:uncharacterized membrane protein YbhN (UPF0104 family)
VGEEAGSRETIGGAEAAASPPRARARAWTRLALAWAIALGLLVWVTRRVSFGELAGSVRPPPWWAWALAVVGLAASYGFRGLRIHSELSRRHPVTRWQCLRVMLLHNTAVNVVPMRGGEAAYPLLVNRQLGVPLGQAVASLVWIRSQDMLLLLLLAVGFVPWLPAWAKVAAVVLVLALVLALIAVVQRFVARRGTAPAPRSKLVRAALAALQALSDAPRHGVAGWVYGSASWAVKLLALGLLLSHLGGLDLLDALAGALVGELAGILPIQGPANFGTYEAGVWAGASLYGGPSLRVAAPAVALHLFSLATAIAAGAIAYALSPRTPAVRPAEDPHA